MIEKSWGIIIKDEVNGPFRVWKKKNDYPGLALSRFFCDFDGKRVGVI